MNHLGRILALGLGLVLSPAALAQQSPVQLVPRFTPGQALRFQLDFRATSEGHTSGAVENPQAPSRVETSVSAIVKLEVLDPKESGACPGCARIRASYDKLTSATRTDGADPQIAENQVPYEKLEGRSIEFTFHPDATISDVRGPDDILPEERKAAQEWLAQLVAGTRFPAEGIVPGQKWSFEQPSLGAVPLVGLVWRAESTYLRNEPCRLAGLTPEEEAEPAPSGEPCAVILTRSVRAQRDSAGDPTPEAFRQRGLRTAGKARGISESLTYVCLRTGWVMSVTQSGEEEIDLSISAADGELRARWVARVRSQSHIFLLNPPAFLSR